MRNFKSEFRSLWRLRQSEVERPLIAESFELPLPDLLVHLIAHSVWPSQSGPSMGDQDSHPIIATEIVKRFAPEEKSICLAQHPFSTIARERDLCPSDFWERFGALEQINPQLALTIGDFGIGSDAPIILDYSGNPSNPPVLRLRWGSADEVNQWVRVSSDFDEFAQILGFDESA